MVYIVKQKGDIIMDGTGQIFILKDDNTLIEVKNHTYDSENLLQALLSEYPNLLAGEQINTVSPRRWLLISREVSIPSEESGTGRWSVDHLFIDQDGVPTLVEVKRSSDTRIRREVVGQMLDYAANATIYWSVDSIKNSFQKTCAQHGKDADEALQSFLEDEDGIESFWDRVKTNLNEGRLRLLFVADKIPDELIRIVEFLNDQMTNTEVLAVEVRQYAGQGIKTLVSRVIGQTSKAQQKKAVYVRWDQDSFFQKARNNIGEKASILQTIFDWAVERNLSISWGVGKETGSYTIRVINKDDNRPFSLLSIFSDGGGQIPFGEIAKAYAEEELKQAYDDLIKIKGISLKNHTKWPTFTATNLNETTVHQFLEIMSRFIS